MVVCACGWGLLDGRTVPRHPTHLTPSSPHPPNPPQPDSDIDFVAASFVRKAQDIDDIRAYLAEQMKEFWPADHPHPKIIAKIESTGTTVF